MCKEILYNQAEERARNETLNGNDTVTNSTSPNSTNEFSMMIEKLPSKNLQELKKFNSDLRDKNYALKVKRYLESVGGLTKHVQVRGMLRTLMKDEVALNFSFCGQRKKQAIKDFRIWDLILDVAIQPNDRRYTCHNAGKTCMLWFKQAQKRLNDANKKKSRAQNNGITEDRENSEMPQSDTE